MRVYYAIGFTALLIVLICGSTLTEVYAAQDDESLWLTALAKFDRGEFDKAITDLNGIISSRQSNYESSARLLLGRCYLQKRDWSQAERTARQL
ncbi:hypothetical protein KKA00_05375, partial [bacterium]|nr:hypothetical protein [bacterium]